MEFYFSPPDGCKVDDEFKKEMECLVKEEVDLDGPFDVRCDDIEMKHDFDVDSSDTISFSKFNENDIWKEKHAWAINNDDDKISNSDFHLDFIGGSPESALMVNPNIVIPNDRSFLYVNEEDYKVANAIGDKKSISYNDASTAVEIIKSAKVSNGINLQAKNFLNCFDISSARNTFEVSVNVDSDHFESSIISSENDKLSQVDENELIFGSKNLKINFQQPKANIKQVLSENKDDNEKIDESKDDYGRIFRSKCIYPKPAFSYSCLISMALKNSKEGCLPVSEIYNFMCNHFPYFKTAPSGWKNSVRHNLSLNKCFEKIEKPPGATQRKGCLWALNPNKAGKMDDEVRKWTSKYRTGIEMSMVFPEHLELLEKGELKNSYSMQDKDEEELCDDEFDDENDSESNKIKDLDLQGASLINISDLDNISCFNSQEENEIFEELLNSVECDNLFNTGDSTAESIITVTAVTSSEEGCSKTNDEYTRTFIDDNIRQIFVPVSVANKSNFLPSKGKKSNLKMNDVLLMRNDAMSKKICNALMSSKNCDQKAVIGDDLLQFQDVSPKGQQHGAKYITVHKSSKSVKSAKKLLLKRLSTFE